jgi:plastocyanin
MNKKILFSLLSFALLSVLLGACKIIDASTLPKATPVQMGSSQFIQQEVTIGKGESVSLVNPSASNHVIVNGQWTNGTQEPKTEPNAPTINTNIAAGASYTLGPFAVAGDYHIYCNIHPGMNLVIHVK